MTLFDVTIFAALLSSVFKGQYLTLCFVWKMWWALEPVMFLFLSTKERSSSAIGILEKEAAGEHRFENLT